MHFLGFTFPQGQLYTIQGVQKEGVWNLRAQRSTPYCVLVLYLGPKQKVGKGRNSGRKVGKGRFL